MAKEPCERNKSEADNLIKSIFGPKNEGTFTPDEFESIAIGGFENMWNKVEQLINDIENYKNMTDRARYDATIKIINERAKDENEAQKMRDALKIKGLLSC